MKAYIDEVQRDSAATNFISVRGMVMSINRNDNDSGEKEFPDASGVYPYIPEKAINQTEQNLSEVYINYLETNLKSADEKKNLVLGISYTRNTALNLITQTPSGYAAVDTKNWSETLDNREYLATQYDALAGKGLPTAFSVVSLIVSGIMIAIITYASVIERIKEIGIIRSLGGRKRHVSRVFKAEACIIGGVSAVIALAVTLMINPVINLILNAVTGVSTIARLGFGTAMGMILLAVGLNLIASLIPARIAAKKDPVVALRTE